MPSSNRSSSARTLILHLVLALLLGAGARAGEALPPWKAALAPPDQAWRGARQHFILNNDSEPETLDPGISTGVQEARISLALFEGLTTLDPRTLEPRPGVAESWTIDAGRTVYTFTLRADARWSDGTPLTSADFVASWRRTLSPATASNYAYMLHAIAGAERFGAQTAAAPVDFNTVGVVARDPRTLVVTLAAPCSYFLDLTAFHTLAPVPVRLIEQHGDGWIRPGVMVGNGPFRLESWQPRQSLVAVRNQHYWDDAFTKLERITFLPYAELETAYKLYRAGGMHWLPTIPVLKIDEIRRDADYYVMPYLGTYFYRFNCGRPPFDDVRVRKAFCLALDRRQITDHILKGGQEPVASFCPPVAGYEPIEGLATDREAARAQLMAAGYGPGGKPFPQVDLLYNELAQHKQIAEAVVQQWKDVLGVQVSLSNCEWKTYLDRLDQQDYELARSSWIGDYGDPTTFFDLFVRDGGNNRTGWSQPRYDQLLAATRQEADPAKRLALFQDMERILVVDECPILPVYRYVNQGLLKPEVDGWHENVRGIHPYQYLWLEP